MKKILLVSLTGIVLLLGIFLLFIYSLDDLRIDEKKLTNLCSNSIKKRLNRPNSFVLIESSTMSGTASQILVDEYKSKFSNAILNIIEKSNTEFFERTVFITFEVKDIYSTSNQHKAMCEYLESKDKTGYRKLSELLSVMVGNKLYRKSESLEWLLLESKSVLEIQKANVYKKPTFKDRLDYIFY